MHIDPTLYTGRPQNLEGRLPREVACYDLLDRLAIPYTRVDHDPADTIAACHEIEKVLGAPICKNLVLCNRQKTAFYLLLMEGDKPFRTKDLSKQIGSARLSFAAPEDMETYLGVTPGSATILALANDPDHKVQLILDRTVAETGHFGCHPCINTFDSKPLYGRGTEDTAACLGDCPPAGGPSRSQGRGSLTGQLDPCC